jgi:hypothetical protein
VALIRRLHVPMRAAADVIPHLGKPHHWKEGRSAKLLVDQWWAANALPASIIGLLNQADEWRGAELVDAFVERQTDLKDGRPSHSQSDLLAIVALADCLGIVAIEAKVDEGFDKTVGEWLVSGGAGKAVRLAKLCDLFGRKPADVAGLRYQLFHRTASAILEARRYRARQAVMIVQSWCPSASGISDFLAFLHAIDVPCEIPGKLSDARVFDGVALRVGWSPEPANPVVVRSVGAGAQSIRPSAIL